MEMTRLQLTKNNMDDQIKKALHSLNSLRVKEKGWDISNELPDARDKQFSESFKEEIAGASIPSIFRYEEKELPKRPFQDHILSCVSCTCTYINMFHSKRENNAVKLSWRDVYANVRHYAGGTSVRENLDWLKHKGQCLDYTLPEREYFLGEPSMQNKNLVPAKARQEAERYKIASYYYLKPYSKLEMKTAILKAPVGICIDICRNWYTTKPGVAIQWDNKPRGGHLVSLIGWTSQGYIVADWDNREYKLLSYNYPLKLAFFICDKSDFKKDMLKPRKVENSSRLLVILPNGKYQFISSSAQWASLNDKKLLQGETKLITESELKKMEKDEEPLVVVK